MGKKRGGGGGALGRAIIRDTKQATRRGGRSDSWLHTSELNDGYNWGRLNLQSVTEQNSLDEFLATAELAGTEFIAEKLNVKIVSAEARTGLLTAEETRNIKKLHEENKRLLCIPRRPHWDENTAAEELKLAERETFLEWRRQLALLEEEQKLILTPFERNLDFWRQLWRVIERSDIIVQIVDARNPLLFRCEDVERYVKEVQKDKVNMIILNKADLLSREQRRVWASYFDKEGMRVVFWSATAEKKRLDAEAKGEELEKRMADGNEEEVESEGEPCDQANDQPGEGSCSADEDDDDSEYEDCKDEEFWETCSEEEKECNSMQSGSRSQTSVTAMNDGSSGAGWMESDGRGRTAGAADSNAAQHKKQFTRNSSLLIERNELLEIFKTMHQGAPVKDGEITVGLVGYPNVGKSSTINTILCNKKVSVSATPGHTKHFQTLYVEPDLCLCDCPGLVMPSFVSTKAEMVCCGILPIDQMRDHVPPTSLHIPRDVLEATYGLNIIRPREDEDPDRAPTSEEFLTAYGYMRGFMTAHGQPDQPRSARYILKDYVTGRLLYCHPPPGIDPADFQFQHDRMKESVRGQDSAGLPGKRRRVKRIENDVDKSFFHQENVRALTKGVQNVMGLKPGLKPGVTPTTGSGVEHGVGKPWKKHGNRNKKEKVRRLCKHLDG